MVGDDGGWRGGVKHQNLGGEGVGVESSIGTPWEHGREHVERGREGHSLWLCQCLMDISSMATSGGHGGRVQAGGGGKVQVVEKVHRMCQEWDPAPGYSISPCCGFTLLAVPGRAKNAGLSLEGDEGFRVPEARSRPATSPHLSVAATRCPGRNPWPPTRKSQWGRVQWTPQRQLLCLRAAPQWSPSQ